MKAFRAPLTRLLPVLLLISVPLAAHAAAAVSLGFSGAGLYPLTATNNSQRWFRANVTWNAAINSDGVPAEEITGLQLVGVSYNNNAGGTGKSYTSDATSVWGTSGSDGTDNPAKGIAMTVFAAGDTTVTVGPFAGPQFGSPGVQRNPAQYLVGTVPGGTGPGGTGWNYYFVVSWGEWDSTTKVYDAQPVVYSPVGSGFTVTPSYQGTLNADESFFWYSGAGSNLPPLQVQNQGASNPNTGASSDDYTFYVSYLNTYQTMPIVNQSYPTFRGTLASEMPAENADYVSFDNFVAQGLLHSTWNDGNKVEEADGTDEAYYDFTSQWGYPEGGGGKFDSLGYSTSFYQENGATDPRSPQVLLVIDHQYSVPYYMHYTQASPNGSFVYRYDIKPTNYLEFFNSILGFPLNISGPNARDSYASAHGSSPACNNYLALGPGPHTYEFLACRDWDPPVDKVTDYQTGTSVVGQCMRCLWGRPGLDEGVVDLITVNGGEGGTSYGKSYTIGAGVAIAGTGQIGPVGGQTPDGFGYPYNSQSGAYPKVDPVISGWPGIFQNLTAGAATDVFPPLSTSFWTYPFNTTPSTTVNNVDGTLGEEPWGNEVGPRGVDLLASGYNQPTQITNADTILPNIMNDWQDAGSLVAPYDPSKAGYDPTTVYNLADPAPFRGGKWTTSTNYVFRCLYFQSDGHAPLAAQVFIRKTDTSGNPTTGWMPFSMKKVYATQPDSDAMSYYNPTTQTWVKSKGVQYFYQSSASSLPGGGGSGDYNYYFSFSDGTHTAIYPNRPFGDDINDPGYVGVPPGNSTSANDYFWFRVATPPVLSSPSVYPPSGGQGTDFLFNTTYADQDSTVLLPAGAQLGDKPYKSIMWINLFGNVEGQMVVNSVAGNVITYGFASPIPTGGGQAYTSPIATLYPGTTAKVHFQTGTATNQEVTITANTASGTTGTITVSSLPTGVAVGNQFEVVAFYPVNMVQTDPTLTDYQPGVQFNFDTARAGMKLDPGTHPYYFEFWSNWYYWINWNQYFMTQNTPIDGKLEGEMVRLPAATNTYYAGPTILAEQPPTLSKFYFAPPNADVASQVVNASTLDYIPPVGYKVYNTNEIAGKYLQFLTGLAVGHVYAITANTGTSITVSPRGTSQGLVTDRVVLGDTFRVFNNWDATDGLAGAYHQNVATTFDGTPGTGFLFFATYAEQNNNPATTIRLAVYSSYSQAENSPDAVYNMTQTVPNTDYVAGAEYETSQLVYFQPGQHWFRVQAFDGNAWANGGTSSDFYGPSFNSANAATGPNVIVDHPPNPPLTGFSPANGQSVATANPTLRWDPGTVTVTGDSVVSYVVQLSKTGFTNGAYDYQYTTTTNTVAVTDNLTDQTTWSWRVLSVDNLGEESVWSVVQNFFVNLNTPPPVLAPPNGDPTQALTPVQGDLSTQFVYTIV
jgi:hypothetical protein